MAKVTKEIKKPKWADGDTLILAKPIQHGSEVITQLKFREPIAKDFRDIPVKDATTGNILDLAASICEQPPSVINRLGIADMGEVLNFVGSFM